MLISKHIADPHANGMAAVFFSDLLYMRAEKKTLFDHHMV